MIELWVILSVVAAFLWSVTHLINKFVLSKEAPDVILATFIDISFFSVLFMISSLIFGNGISIPFYFMFIAIFAGVFYGLASYFYYSAMRKGEISRIASFNSLSPIFVLILAFLFLGERLTMINYLGIGLIVSGSFLISIEKDHSKYIFSKVFVIVIISALFGAFREFFIKFATIQISLWTVLFWVGFGAGLSSLFLFALHHPHIRKKTKNGIKHLLFGRVTSGTAFLIYFIAISMTSVSLVSAFVKLDIFFIFVATTILSYSHSNIIREKINLKIFLQKLISITFILVGVFSLV